jgi:hypothetical protein
MDLSSVPAHTRAGLMKLHPDGDMPLLGRDRQELCKDIIARYMGGAKMQQIAEELGVARAYLYQILIEHADEDWKRATTAKALSRHENAIDGIEAAPDALSLNRAREMARTAQWELERVCRRIYGTDPPQVSININLGDISEQIKALEADLGVNAAVLLTPAADSGDSDSS